MSVSEGIVPLTVYVPASIRRRLKVAAAQNGKTMAHFLADLLDLALTKRDMLTETAIVSSANDDMIS